MVSYETISVDIVQQCCHGNGNAPVTTHFCQDQGVKGRSEQRRSLHTKALMRDLGTRLECRQRVFVRTGKTFWK